MRFAFSIVALCALCAFVSGCGCSKEKEAPVPRMEDPAYTNALVELHGEQVAIAGKAGEIRAKIAALGEEPEKSPEYADLTNRLAQCEAEAKAAKARAFETVRARILKESLENKENLKK